MKWHIDSTKLFTHNKLVYKRTKNHEQYFLNGKRHNPNGPAYRLWYHNGRLWYDEYYLNGVRLLKYQFVARLKK